jgi:hypothetical protein
MPKRLLWCSVVTLCLTACGTGGGSDRLAGKVSVSGGSANGIGVTAIGPSTGAAVTDSSGAFTIDGLKDGAYVVSAHVAAAEPPDQQTVVMVTKDASDMATLKFNIPAGTVSGKVVFSDMSDASGLSVVLTGTQTFVTSTDMTGAYSFKNLPGGSYTVSVDALDTREHHLAAGFVLTDTAASQMLPDLVFTPTGTLTGTVTAATGLMANGAVVQVLGTGLSAVVDAMGNFELDGVPAGMRTVSASVGGAIPQFASATVAVTRGANMRLMLALMTGTGPSGTVTGSVTFWGSGYDNLITVEAVGSGVTATLGLQGSFALTLPPGEWDIQALAPLYPTQLIGHVTVKEGGTVSLPPTHMSIYRRFDPEPGITAFNVLSASEVNDWFVYSVVAGGVGQLWIANARSMARRMFFEGFGLLPAPVLSRTGRYVAYANGPMNQQVIDLLTGAQVTLSRNGTSPAFDFSTDESAFFTYDSLAAQALTRYQIATSTRKDYPGFAMEVSRDRWLVNNLGAITLVTPTTDTLLLPSTNTSNVSLGSSLDPVPYGYTGCAGIPGAFTGCTLNIVPRTGMATVPVSGTYSVPGTTLQSTAPAFDWTADYFVLGTTSPSVSWKLVKVADGSTVALPATTTRVNFSEDGSRVAYVSTSAGMTQIHEEALPATGTAAPVATVTAGYNLHWLSGKRLIIFDDNAAAPRRIDVKAGVATIDTDFVVGTGVVRGPFAYWSTSSNMKRAAVVADSAVYALDIPSMDTVNAFGGTEGVAGPGRWGVICDMTSGAFKGTFVMDATKPMPRVVTDFQVQGNGTRVHSYPAQHWNTSSEPGLLTFTTDELFALSEPDLASAVIVGRVTLDSLVMNVANFNAASSQVVVTTLPIP